MSQGSATARLLQMRRQSPASTADSGTLYPDRPVRGLSRVLRSFCRPLPKAEKRKDEHDHDDQANQIDQTIHNNLLRPAILSIARSDEGSLEFGDPAWEPTPGRRPRFSLLVTWLRWNQPRRAM